MAKNPESVAASSVVIQVPVNKVRVDWTKNASRQFATPEQLEEYLKNLPNDTGWMDTAKDIKANGMLNPAILRPTGLKGGKQPEWEMVAAFHRIAAVIYNATGGKEWIDAKKCPDGVTIPAIVRNLTDAEAFALNVKENVLRKAVTKFQLAKAAVEFVQQYSSGNKGKATENSSNEVGEKFGVSGSYIRGLKRVYENLHADILKAWSERNEDKDFATFKATTYNNLVAWAGIKDDKGNTGTPAAQKRQLGAFALEIRTFNLMSAGDKTEKDAREQAEEELAKGGVDLPKPVEKCGHETKDGRTCKLVKGHKDAHEYPDVRISAESVRELRGKLNEAGDEMADDEAEFAKAMSVVCSFLLKGQRGKLEYDGTVYFEPGKPGDVAEENEPE